MIHGYYICHYGVKEKSGRYDWGSGDRPYQRLEKAKMKIKQGATKVLRATKKYAPIVLKEVLRTTARIAISSAVGYATYQVGNAAIKAIMAGNNMRAIKEFDDVLSGEGFDAETLANTLTEKGIKLPSDVTAEELIEVLHDNKISYRDAMSEEQWSKFLEEESEGGKYTITVLPDGSYFKTNAEYLQRYNSSVGK